MCSFPSVLLCQRRAPCLFIPALGTDRCGWIHVTRQPTSAHPPSTPPQPGNRPWSPSNLAIAARNSILAGLVAGLLGLFAWAPGAQAKNPEPTVEPSDPGHTLRAVIDAEPQHLNPLLDPDL